MQLIEITSTPIKYELEITPAKLEYNLDQIPKIDLETTPSELKINTQNVELRLDTYEARKSIGFENVADRIKSAAQKGMQSISDVTREYVETGKQMANIEDGVTIPDIIKQKMQAQPQMVTAFLPSSRAEIFWQPSNINIDYKASKLETNWSVNQTEMSYIPGSVHMQIVQKPEIQIEYLGRPIYIPKSADPEYEE